MHRGQPAPCSVSLRPVSSTTQIPTAPQSCLPAEMAACESMQTDYRSTVARLLEEDNRSAAYPRFGEDRRFRIGDPILQRNRLLQVSTASMACTSRCVEEALRSCTDGVQSALSDGYCLWVVVD